MSSRGRITAILGPTNTGKTHHAIERMLGHRSGVIGLPLRLLAREVYDRIVKARGPSVVALVTGEERIVPPRVQYWVATTEAMPDIAADFVAIDEIQLCADPGRGHVFTDRLLHMRGTVETLFLGSDTMRKAIAALVPETQFIRRERFSKLNWAGSKKLSRMPARSAIVGFSVDDVYAMAELLRRQKGGCAVVMGALSPRTRNAQVEMYQNGEVDYLVATDAIGMGLNLDIKHVAFSATHKFDGRRVRPLFPHEMGQIAGRAGRHTEPGTFGVTGEAEIPDDGLIEALENHRFAPIQRLTWRNGALEFGTMDRLIDSLETGSGHELLSRGREADDLATLKILGNLPEIRDRVQGGRDVRLLWDVCRVPDFRGISQMEHATLLARIFGFLQDGHIPADWLGRAITRIDKVQGDIDALSKRLAYIRTWTYVAQRTGWVADEKHWREETRAVEDRLSDALHAALTQRFVDRRTSVLLRRLKQKESLVAEVNDKGEVTVEGEYAGRLEGFRFRPDQTASADEAKMLSRASYDALKPEFHLRADRFYNAPDTEMDYTEQGGLMWGTQAVGKLVKGSDPLHPGVEVFVDEEAGPEIADKVRRRAQHFIDRKIAALFEPLVTLQKDEALTGLARGFAFRLVEALGILPRDAIATEVKELDQEARGALRKHGVRFGQFTIFLPALLKPAPTRLRLVLWSLHEGLSEFPESPPPGLVTIPHLDVVPDQVYALSGYRPAGERAIRIDMLERLADLLRAQDTRGGFEANPDMLSITGMTLEQFSGLMQGLGYAAERGERPKVKAVEAPVVAPAPQGEGSDAPLTEEESVLATETRAKWEAEQAEKRRIEAEAAAATPEAETAEGEASEAGAVEGEATSEAPAPEEVTPEEAAPEMEVFYSFRWAPKPRGNRRPQGDRPQGERAEGERPQGQRRGPRRDGPREGQAREGAAPAGAAASGDRPRGDAPQGERRDRNGAPGQGKPGGKFAGKPGGGKRDGRDGGGRDGGGRDGKPSHQGPKTFSSRPEKKADPDSPFAILAQLKDKG
ncbi:disulfide oxidoreductase [Paracoccus liaowanqingii]|uniref:Disulfide oxidoreductase n=1 Tax=Paracoccus liaowanqingii TaxID=2560053 RepID=A0A4P7HP29_9RHOB|nr:helicase-related protein [Paracoccus liaowanqingii]QBX36074.1 disulfide oxidoreductase [Paracoccus liaowanqingii]